MKYILITLIFLSGCVTWEADNVGLSEADVLNPVSADLVNSGQDIQHREKAKELGISYVDYLHLVNNNKKRVLRSRLKLSHQLDD